MKIEKMRICHLSQPLGYQISRPVFSWVVSEATGKKQHYIIKKQAKEDLRNGLLLRK